MSPRPTCAEVLQKHSQDIMSRWESRTLKEVSAAYGQTSLVLRNALPDLLNSLQILLSSEPRTTVQIGIDAANLLESSKEHGRGRAEIPTYVLSQVILEYQILRQTLFQVLDEQCELSTKDRELLTSAIEEAVNVAATEFSLVLRELQDQFMLSIAHDLKNPITATQTGAELILHAPRSDMTVPLAENMIRSLKKMTEMVESFHDRSRLQAGRGLVLPLSDCDIHAILHEVVGDLNLVYGNCFLIRSEGALHGQWNAEYLRRLIENIVNNAVKYRAPGSLVTLSLQTREANAELTVHNRGETISPGDQAQLFTSVGWKKSGRTPKGWGLGLSLAKGIVDALGGSIRVESQDSTGTTFTVSLPRQSKASVPEDKAA